MKHTERKPERRVTDDEEVEGLTHRCDDPDMVVNQSQLAESRGRHEESKDAQEYSQTY